MQPAFSEKVWRAELIKMREKYGAPIGTNEVERLVGYFFSSYGTK